MEGVLFEMVVWGLGGSRGERATSGVALRWLAGVEFGMGIGIDFVCVHLLVPAHPVVILPGLHLPPGLDLLAEIPACGVYI